MDDFIQNTTPKRVCRKQSTVTMLFLRITIAIERTEGSLQCDPIMLLSRSIAGNTEGSI